MASQQDCCGIGFNAANNDDIGIVQWLTVCWQSEKDLSVNNVIICKMAYRQIPLDTCCLSKQVFDI